MANYQLNVKVNGVEQAVSTIGDLEQALSATKEELRGLEIGSDAFNELTVQARNLQGELDRTFERATNFNSSLTVITESVSRLGSSVAAGFSLAISSLQLLGDEGEELTEAQVKAQQALAIAFSATTIATNASTLATDAKIVADRISLGFTNLITAAAGRETIAKAAAAVATGTATTAQIALNAAMNANPILLVVSALGALIGAFALFSDSTEDAKDETDNFNQVLARTNKAIQDSSKAIEDEIKLQRRLIKLRGDVAADNAKNETERLQIRLETQKRLDELDLKSLDVQANNLQSQLNNIRQSNTEIVNIITDRYEQLSQLEDINIDSALTKGEQYIAQLTLQYREDLDNKELTEQQKAEATETYYTALFAFQEQQILNDTTLTEEERKNALERFNNSKELQRQLNLLAKERAIVVGEQARNERLAQEQIVITQRESLKKRKEALEEYNKDVEDLTKDRIEKLEDLERQFQDILIERIASGLVNGEKLYENIAKASADAADDIVSDTQDIADGIQNNAITSVEEFIRIYNETGELPRLVNFDGDIIAQFDEQITALKVARDRANADAKEQFEQSVEDFREAETKRGIDAEQIEQDIQAFKERFRQEDLQRQENFNTQITELEQRKANQIADIDRVLRNELTFGDNSFADNRQSLLLESIDFEIQQAERRIEIERGYNVEVITERQRLESEKRKLLRDSLLEQQRIELEEALKTVQGTEEQKGQQRESLIKLYNDRVAKINEDFRTGEELAERQSTDEIFNYKIQKLQEFSNVGFNILNGILGFAQSLSQLRQVETENAINELRDFTAQQTEVLNEFYNADLANLEARFSAGLITQEQYNQSVTELQNALDKSTEKLQQDQQKKELALRKKAFEDDKRLKIAQAIISGLQGAAQAFATAFQLGPIAGPIVGASLAALVAATTAAQVAAIRKTKFDSGGSVNINGGGSSVSADSVGGIGGSSNLSSGGGFTSFNENLVGTPTGDTSQSGDSGKRQEPNRVYVLESDITSTQQRVSVAESSATFG